LPNVRPNVDEVKPRGWSAVDNGLVTEFTEGQYVELYCTIPSSPLGSIDSGTLAIVRTVDGARSDDEIYLVEFLAAEKATGERVWLRAIDLAAP
jgi:hypothetical protein